MSATFIRSAEADPIAGSALAAHEAATGDTHGVDDFLALLDAGDLQAHADTTDDVHGIASAADLQLISNKDQPDGYPSLDGSGKVPVGQIPNIAIGSVSVVANQTEQLLLNATANEGDIVRRTDQSKTYVFNGGVAGTMADWTEITAVSSVTSVAGRTGDITIVPADVSGLEAQLPRAYLAPTPPATGKARLLTWSINGGGGPVGVAPGVNGQILSIDFTVHHGLKWIDPPAGGSGGSAPTITTLNINGNTARDITTPETMIVATLTGTPASLTLNEVSIGDYIEVYVIQDATGGRVYNGPSADWEAGQAPVASIAAGKMDAYGYRCIDNAGRLIGYDLGRDIS